MEQVCNRCGVAKLLNRDNFYNNAKRPNGFEPTCIPCRKAARKTNPSYGRAKEDAPKDSPSEQDNRAVLAVFGENPREKRLTIMDLRGLLGWDKKRVENAVFRLMTEQHLERADERHACRLYPALYRTTGKLDQTKNDGAALMEALGYRVPQIHGARVVDMDRGRAEWTVNQEAV